MDTTKEQRGELRRILAEASDKEPLDIERDIQFPGCSTSWVRTQRALIAGAADALPALLDMADECEALRERERLLEARAEHAEMEVAALCGGDYDAVKAELDALLGHLAAIRDMVGAWPSTEANNHGYAMSFPDGVVDLVKAERERLAERVRELEAAIDAAEVDKRVLFSEAAHQKAQRDTLRRLLDVAVGAFDKMSESWTESPHQLWAREVLATIRAKLEADHG